MARRQSHIEGGWLLSGALHCGPKSAGVPVESNSAAKVPRGMGVNWTFSI